MKKIVTYVVCAMLMLACSFPGAGPKDAAGTLGGIASAGTKGMVTQDASTYMRYPYGIKSASPWSYDKTFGILKIEYDYWKSYYLTSEGAGGPGNLRVKRDAASNYDTVSEGQAYAMLLAVYFDDRETFDQLFSYVLQHSDKDRYGYLGLMHWMMTADNVETNEFNIPTAAFEKDEYVLIKINCDNLGRMYIANPDNPVYVLENDLTDEQKNAKPEPNGVVYLRACRNDRRKRSSATDADLDIAASMVMAAQKWDNGRYNYHQYAVEYIRSVLAWDIEYVEDDDGILYNNFWLKAGNLWGGKKGWNPCYFVPSWFKMFIKYIDSHPNDFRENITLNLISDDWGLTGDNYECTASAAAENLIQNMYHEMLEISEFSYNHGGLFPDWVDTQWIVPLRPDDNSDRRYYTNELVQYDPDGNPYPLYLDMSLDKNGSGTLEFVEGLDRQSMNYYYDAVRVPWRMALDYSLTGDPRALEIVSKMAVFLSKDLSDTTTGLVDGYSWLGDKWDPAYKDGFNGHIGGEAESVTFIAMNATASMVLSGTPDIARTFYGHVYRHLEDMNGKYHYYGNIVRMLSLVYMSGAMIDYGNLSEHPTDGLPIDVQQVGPVSIDLNHKDFAVYASDGGFLHDRAKFFNSDKSDYSNVGSGFYYRTYTWGEKLDIGVDTIAKNIYSALPGIMYRTNFSQKEWVISRGYIDVQSDRHIPRIIPDYTGDPGYMQYGLNQPEKIVPDYYKNGDKYKDCYPFSPGHWGNYKIYSGAAASFTSGVYHFASFSTEPDVNLVFDTSAGPVIIYIKDSLSVKSRTRFRNALNNNEGADPSKILIICAQTSEMFIEPQVNWRGTLIAPESAMVHVRLSNSNINNALVEGGVQDAYKYMDYNGEVFGALWGKRMDIASDSAIYYVPLDWEAVKQTILDEGNPGPAPPPPEIIDLTGFPSGQNFTVSGEQAFKILTGGNGVIQINKPWQQDVQVSINGGAFQPTPFDWGGPFNNLGSNSEVMFTVSTTQSQDISLSWW